jgi:hypothetical protein
MDPVAVGKHELLHRIVEPGMYQDRATLLLQRLFRHASGTVR